MSEENLATPAPVDAAERVEALDTVRGFALLGILLMNICSFGMPSAAEGNPTVWGGAAGADSEGRILVVHRWGIGGPEHATVVVLSFSGRMQDAIVRVPSSGKSWRCVFSSDFSGYHESGTDSALQCVSNPENGDTLILPNFAPYGAAIYVCDE